MERESGRNKTKNEIIEEIARNKTIEGIISNLVAVEDDEKDLIQDLYLDLLQKDEELITHLYETNELKFFITRACINQIRSKNSPYFYKYKKRNLNKVNIDEVKDKL